MGVLNVYFFSPLKFLLEVEQAIVQLILKRICHGHQFNIFIGLQGLVGGTGTTTATAYYGQLQFFIIEHIDHGVHLHSR